MPGQDLLQVMPYHSGIEGFADERRTVRQVIRAGQEHGGGDKDADMRPLRRAPARQVNARHRAGRHLHVREQQSESMTPQSKDLQGFIAP